MPAPPWVAGEAGEGARSQSGPVYPLTALVLKALAHKTLVLLLGVDPSRQLDHPLPTGHPQVTYAYMKNMWKSARKVCIRMLSTAGQVSASHCLKARRHPHRLVGGVAPAGKLAGLASEG